jgi:hypothetical protein
MDPRRVAHYRAYFSTKEYSYRQCAIVFDETNIRSTVRRTVDNFASNYDAATDIVFGNVISDNKNTTFEVKGINNDWWFIIQIKFHGGPSQQELKEEVKKLISVIFKIGLTPRVCLADMTGKYYYKINFTARTILLLHKPILCYFKLFSLRFYDLARQCITVEVIEFVNTIP